MTESRVDRPRHEDRGEVQGLSVFHEILQDLRFRWRTLRREHDAVAATSFFEFA